MAYGDIGAILDTLVFAPVQGYNCSAIHINGDVHAAVYVGPANKICLTTMLIGVDGAMPDATIATLELSAAWSTWPNIIHVDDDVYAIAYQNSTNGLTVQPVSISPNGTTLTPITLRVIKTTLCRAPKLIHIDGDVYAITYLIGTHAGVEVSTITINAAGEISAIIDTLILTGSGKFHTEIVHVDGDVYAIAYSDTSTGVTVATVTIAANGSIDDTVIDTQVIYEAPSSYGLAFTESWPGVFAVAYPGAAEDGFVSTVIISAAGAISIVQDTLEVCVVDTRRFNLLHIKSGICAAAYKKTTAPYGEIATLQVNADGSIDDAVIDRLAFEGNNATEDMILHIAGDVYAICPTSTGLIGSVITLDISTPLEGVPHHEMMMGMGP